MRYALKNLRVKARASRETVAFTAELRTASGDLVAHVSNSGTGGAHLFHFAPGAGVADFRSFATATGRCYWDGVSAGLKARGVTEEDVIPAAQLSDDSVIDYYVTCLVKLTLRKRA